MEIAWKQCGVMNMRRRLTGSLGLAADCWRWREQDMPRIMAERKAYIAAKDDFTDLL